MPIAENIRRTIRYGGMETFKRWEPLSGIEWPCGEADISTDTDGLTLRLRFSTAVGGGERDLLVQIEHFRRGKHTYQRLEIFAGLELNLCNSCMVDFGAYDPSYFGARGARIGFERMRVVGDVPNPSVGKDKYCPECHRRLTFLRFLAAARDLHSE